MFISCVTQKSGEKRQRMKKFPVEALDIVKRVRKMVRERLANTKEIRLFAMAELGELRIVRKPN